MVIFLNKVIDLFHQEINFNLCNLHANYAENLKSINKYNQEEMENILREDEDIINFS